MTCASSRRPGSDPRDPLGLRPKRTAVWTPALAVLLVLFDLLVPSAGAARAAEPVLRFAPGLQTTAEMRDWLRNDAAWLRGRPPLPSGAGRELPAAGDSLGLADLTRRWTAAAAAAGDTVLGASSRTASLTGRWLDRGFLQARVATRGDTLEVDPGPVWRLAALRVDGKDFPGRGRLLGLWLPGPGSRLDATALAAGVRRLLIAVGEEGYPFARWVVAGAERPAGDDDAAPTLVLRATLLPGPRAFIGPVGTNLENPRARGFLIRASGLRTGDPFDQAELVRARERLLARDLYLAVDEPVVHLTSAADTVGVHFPVTPRRKQNRLQVILGLSRRADDQAARLSGEVDLSLPNLAGSGRSLRVGWRDDGLTRSRFGFDYREPLAFGTPLDMTLALEQEVEDASYTRFRVDNAWLLPVVAMWGVELGVGWDRSTYPEGAISRSSRTRGRGAVVHLRGDRTRSGWAASFAVETARRSSTLRQEDEAAASQLGADITQRIYEVDAEGELWLSRTLSVAGRAAFRQLSGDERNAPPSEQFRFGGARTLRGYREGELRGTRAAWGGVELRVGAPLGSRLYTFWDVGYLELWTEDPLAEDPAARVRREDWPRGFGLGLLALTPGGDISLAVGFPGTVDFDLAKLHVTLLESF